MTAYWEDDVVHVVEDFTAYFQRHCQIREWFWTARVIDDVSHHMGFQQLPLAVWHVIGQINVWCSVRYIHLQILLHIHFVVIALKIYHGC